MSFRVILLNFVIINDLLVNISMTINNFLYLIKVLGIHSY